MQELFPSLVKVFGEDLEEPVNHYNRILAYIDSGGIKDESHRRGFVGFRQEVNGLYNSAPGRSRERGDVDEGNLQILDNLLGKIRGLFQDIARERGLAV